MFISAFLIVFISEHYLPSDSKVPVANTCVILITVIYSVVSMNTILCIECDFNLYYIILIILLIIISYWINLTVK